MRTPQIVLAGLFGALLGVGAGAVLFSGAGGDLTTSTADDETASLRAEIELLKERLAEARRRETVRPRVGAPDAPEPPGVDPAVDPVGAAAPSAEEEPATATPEERTTRVAELLALQPTWFEGGDGKAAVAALQELAAIVPEGRDAAMQLTLAINRDVNGAGRLGLSDVDFYNGLGHPSVVALADWALATGSPPDDFRVMAAHNLRWTTTEPGEALEQFRQALATERSVDVQCALVASLSRLRNVESERMLADVLADADRDPGVRAMVAMSLATTQDADVLRVLEMAAAAGDDAAVRASARTALIANDPPATGYLVTGTTAPSQAGEGLRAGDIVVRYDGQATATAEQLHAASAAASAADSVRVVVVRDGREVELDMRGGHIGVTGQAVEARER